MPHRHDFDDEPPDIQSFLVKLAKKASQPGGAQLPGPDWQQSPPPKRGMRGKWWLRATGGAVLAVVAAIYYEGVKDDLETGTEDPPGSTTSQQGPAATVPERLYAQRAVEVRGDTARNFDVVRTVPRGERVFAIASGREGWAQLVALDGELIGYAERSAGDFGAEPLPGAPPIPTDTASSKLRARYPSDVAAVCRDGWISESRSSAGTCSGGHGGVEIWINRPEG